ncbi:unnamed protein product [Polarella glacialis]|uniref:Uncharacterized protein n=1 Tax=Polarella glacialis TaxID=89957 RepID=A0A813KK56_POLGL|nr:unnamed protein product [Polarella glacialis]
MARPPGTSRRSGVTPAECTGTASLGGIEQPSALDPSSSAWKSARLAKLSRTPLGRLAAAAARLLASEPDSRELSNVAWDHATASVDSLPPSNGIAMRGAVITSSIAPQGSANLAWHSAKAVLTGRALAAAGRGWCARKAGALEEQGLVNAVWAFAKALHFGCPAMGKGLSRAIAVLLQRLETGSTKTGMHRKISANVRAIVYLITFIAPCEILDDQVSVLCGACGFEAFPVMSWG